MQSTPLLQHTSPEDSYQDQDDRSVILYHYPPPPNKSSLHSSSDIGLDVPRGKVPLSPVDASPPPTPPPVRGRMGLRQWRQRVNLYVFCVVLHAGLIAIHGIPTILFSVAAANPEGKFVFESSFVVFCASRVTPLVFIPGINIIIQSVGVVYTAVLVWLTQQLALRRTLHIPQTITAMHDCSNAWLGLGSAVFSLVHQYRLRSAATDVSAIAVYLLAIFGIHITTPNLINIFNADGCYPGFGQYHITLNIVPCVAGLIFSIILLFSSLILTRPSKTPGSQSKAELHAALDSAGILQYTWLLAHEPHYSTVLPPMLTVGEPTLENLRQAGLPVKVTMSEIRGEGKIGNRSGSEELL